MESKETQQLQDILNEQRIYGVVNHIPILRESEVHLFEELIELYRPISVLEVGTAIGYSTLLLARHLGRNGQVVSIELDPERYCQAGSFVSRAGADDQITLLQGDAAEVIPTLEGPFDLVFLDGPKGQYLKQLELLLPKLADQAVVLADNVLFRDYVRGGKEAPRRFRTIVKRLREYLAFVENKKLFNTTIYPLGDGMSVSVWKGVSHSDSADDSAILERNKM